VSDEMALTLNAAGTADDVAARISAFAQGGPSSSRCDTSFNKRRNYPTILSTLSVVVLPTVRRSVHQGSSRN